MKVDLGIWDKLTRAVIFLLVISGGIAVVIWYLPNFQQNHRMRKRALELEAQIDMEERRQKQLKTSIDLLKNDPRTLERTARERLSYAKPAETVFQFVSPSNAPRALR